MSDLIDIVVKDRGTDRTAANLGKIGDAALAAMGKVDALNASLGSNKTASIISAQARLQKAMNDQAKVAAQGALVNSRAAVATAQLNRATAQAATAQTQLAAAQAKAAASSQASSRSTTAANNAAAAAQARATAANNAAGTAAAGAAAGTARYTKSAKELAFATRGLPAQFTDIAVSLQGGQNPLTVLLQQGGQLKDMFGGVGQASKAMLGYIRGLVTPLSLAVVGVGLLTAALLSAESQMSRLNIAVIQSGNYLGRSGQDLSNYADKLDALQGVTRGSAVDAIAAVVSSGAASQKTFQQMTTATASWAAATGEEVDKIVDKFQMIARDPVNALLKLNEAEHFLTQAQLDRVAALVEEGKAQDAADLANRIYASNLTSRATEIGQNLTNIKQWWNDIKDATSAAFTWLAKYADIGVGTIGRQIDAATQLAGKLWSIGNDTATEGNPIARIKMLAAATAEYAKANTTAVAAEKKASEDRKRAAANQKGDPNVSINSADAKKRLEERKKALTEWNSVTDQNLSKKDAQLKEEARLQKLGETLGYSQEKIDKQIAESRRKYTEVNTKKVKKNTEGESLLESAQRQITANKEQLATNEKLTTSQRQIIAIEQALGDSKNKMTSTVRAGLEAAKAELETTGKQVKAQEAHAKALENLNRIQNEMEQRRQNITAENENEIYGMTHSDAETARRQKQLDIYKWYEGELKSLRDKGIAETSDDYKMQQTQLKAQLDWELEQTRLTEARKAEIRGSYQAGFEKAWTNYMEGVSNISEASESLLTNALSSMESAITSFISTGKAGFSSLTESVIADISRMALRAAASGLFGGASGGGSNSWIGTAINGVMGMFGGGSNVGAQSTAAMMGTNSQLTNSIVTEPTMFKFAKGGTFGVMGEAGAEAVMPLAKDSSGSLGVKVHDSSGGGGASGMPVVNVNVIGADDAKVETSTDAKGNMNIDVLLGQVKKSIAGDIASGNGSIPKAIESRFQVRSRN